MMQNPERYAVIVAIAASLVYLPVLWAPFEFDDMDRILENPAIRNISNIPAFFYLKEIMPLGGDIYRPLGDASFAVDYQIWNYNPFGYHLMNIFLHGLNAVLLFYFLKILFPAVGAAFTGALIFALHPVNTEAVIWIKGREDLLFTSFFLLALIFREVREDKGKRLYSFISAVSFALALLAKEMAVTLPLVMLVTDLLRKRSLGRGRFRQYIPYILVMIFYLLVRFFVLQQLAQRGYWGGGGLPTFYTMTRVISYYFKLLLFPVNLCVDYLGYQISNSITGSNVIPSIVLLAGNLTAAIYAYKTGRLRLFYAISWVFITLFPVMNIIPIKITMAERFLYLPGIGIALISACIVESGLSRRVRIFGIFMIAVLFSLLTLERGYVWSSSSRLWEDAVHKMPKNTRGHFNLASVYIKEGRYDDALRENNVALSLDPADPMAYVNHGLIHALLREPEVAMKNYKRALLLNPKLPKTHHNIGMLYLKQDESIKAVEEFEQELSINPNEKTLLRYYEACIAAGNHLYERGDLLAAIEYYEKARRRISGREEAYLNLALVYRKMGRMADAVNVYEELLRERPDLTTQKTIREVERLRGGIE